MGRNCLKEEIFLLSREENILELDRGGGCTTLNTVNVLNASELFTLK